MTDEELRAEALAAEQELRDSLAALNEVIEQDKRDNPRGHPCRDCGRYWDEHPVNTVLECRDWR